jgi:hypothetical protein
MSEQRDETTAVSTSVDPKVDHPVPMSVHLIAPILAIGATAVARKLLNSSYRKVTGHTAPDSRDPSVSILSALAWTAMTAATAAVVEVGIYRVTARWLTREQ